MIKRRTGRSLTGDRPLFLAEHHIIIFTYNLSFVLLFSRCGHCQRLAPEWKKAASELKGKVKVAALDATVHPSTAQR